MADAYNTEIHPLHVACAAYEKPVLKTEDVVADWFEPEPNSRVNERSGKYVYYGRYPHKNISVRGAGGKTITLKDGYDTTIGRQ